MSHRVIDLKWAFRLLHPRPTVIVVSISKNGEVNGCAVSWITPVNVDPPIVAFSLAPRRYTYKLLKESGEATINIMSFDHMNQTHYVGSVSGRDVKDKLVKAGFKLKSSKKVKPPAIEEALAVLECKVVNEIEYTDHNLILCQVLYAEAKEGVLENGLVPEDIKPLLHVGKNVYTTTTKHYQAKE
ncbi:flavin reductase family protein [Desulfurococcaceae archaeon MEX13E-LK6-19]|nr:flavin reductase family protein [Desulfurococcaceae archaeon MEX13E-LK6-19]